MMMMMRRMLALSNRLHARLVSASACSLSASASPPPPPPPLFVREEKEEEEKRGGKKEPEKEEEEEEEEVGTPETFCLCAQVKINAKIRKDRGHCVYKPVVVDDIVRAKQKDGNLAKRAHWYLLFFFYLLRIYLLFGLCRLHHYRTTLDALVDDAVRKMHDLDVGALVVMDFNKLDVDKSKKIHLEELYYAPKSNAIAGIVSERDYLRAVAMNKVTDLTTVREIMTPAVDAATGTKRLISVEPYCSVLAAMQAMTTGHFRHIPVINSELQTLEGLVSLGDVVKAVISEQDEEIDVLEDYITNGGK